jgi:DNA-binding Lrp family transcriptional regulator
MTISETLELDRLDHRILALVQENNLTPHRVIADKVGLSTPAVTRRLQRLRRSGVIRGDVSLLDAARLGRPLVAITEVTMYDERPQDIDALKKMFLECPQIQHCYYVTGETDFVLIFSLRDMAEYVKLTRNLFFDFGNIRRFKTLVSMETIKSNSLVLVAT